MGQPVGALSRTMGEAEFKGWQVYAARRMLPQRRLEIYLAQIAMLIAVSNGAKDVDITDFLFDPAEPESEPTAEEEAAFFDFKPRKKAENKEPE